MRYHLTLTCQAPLIRVRSPDGAKPSVRARCISFLCRSGGLPLFVFPKMNALVSPSSSDSGAYALSGANLTRADLTEAKLYEADLMGAVLRGVKLGNVNLTEKDLSGVDLRGADLRRSELSGANLTGADLTGANLYGADLTGANLTGVEMGEAFLARTKFCKTITPWGEDNSGC